MTDHNFAETVSPNRYFDRNFNIEAVKILPGEYFVTGRDMVLVTVLGSCVSACIRDRMTGIGGMNHFMLPDSNDGGDPVGVAGRYGTYAMELMINQLLKNGARRANLEAKVFGGGNVLRGFTITNVGQRNAEFVIDYLHAENIALKAQDLLDIYPRKVYFFPATGRTLVRQLRNVHNDTIVQREQQYISRVRASGVQGEVELF
ncbi:MAG: chemoreceptor glutamine deamidase CheD [Gallionella sp.]|jgi:chemotaxis protein CheD|nr:chemoreceptor glutamine deamidase CheD [Gallionella sp.]